MAYKAKLYKGRKVIKEKTFKEFPNLNEINQEYGTTGREERWHIDNDENAKDCKHILKKFGINKK